MAKEPVGKRESLRKEAQRRGVTVYRVRADRAQELGVTKRVAVGKAKPSEQSLLDLKTGIPAATPLRPGDPKQRYKHRYWIDGVYDYGDRFLGVIDSPRRLTIKQIQNEVIGWFEHLNQQQITEHYDVDEMPRGIRVARVTVQ